MVLFLFFCLQIPVQMAIFKNPYWAVEITFVLSVSAFQTFKSTILRGTKKHSFKENLQSQNATPTVHNTFLRSYFHPCIQLQITCKLKRQLLQTWNHYPVIMGVATLILYFCYATISFIFIVMKWDGNCCRNSLRPFRQNCPLLEHGTMHDQWLCYYDANDKKKESVK